MKSQIRFANLDIRKQLKKLKGSTSEDQKLYHWINAALNEIEQNAFCAIQVKKKLIPIEYLRCYDNLWKYNLPQGWRLLYSVASNEDVVISIIIEWCTHKEYERRFKY